MVQIWVVIGLIVAAISVSALGALFSIIGLGKLFTGAVLAVWLMAGSLELAKFVIAAFLHQVWPRLNILYKTYLLVATISLSALTSMGIFGFLSDAYQESTTIMEIENSKLESLKIELQQNATEITRMNKSIDDIPANRVTKKIEARKEAEPFLKQLNENTVRINKDISAAQLKVLEVRNKVGPLIYIAKAFHVDIDSIVKYLIILIVSVFDPLAICLVIAVSEATRLRKLNAHVKSGPTLKMRVVENPTSTETPANEPAQATPKVG